MSSLRRLLPSSHSLTMKILRRPFFVSNLAVTTSAAGACRLRTHGFGPSPFGSRPISDLVRSPNNHFDAPFEELEGLNLEHGMKSELKDSESELKAIEHGSNLSELKSQTEADEDWSWLEYEVSELTNVMEKNHYYMSIEIENVTEELFQLGDEKRKFYKDLKVQGQKIHDNINRLEREVSGLNAQVERAKYDVIIWGGALASVVGICVGIACSSYIHTS